jgi:hypothetical protein
LQDTFPPNKVIFSISCDKVSYGGFQTNLVRRSFRRDHKYKLSHKDLVCYCLFFLHFCR